MNSTRIAAVSTSPTTDNGYFESFDRQKLDPLDATEFRSSMLSFCRSNKLAADALLAGNVEMLGFDKVAENLGDLWPKVRGKVHLLAESVIKRHITANDVFMLASAEQYIVLCGAASRAEATAAANRIADEINEKMHGLQAGSEGVTVRSLVVEVPRDNVQALATASGITESVEDARRAKEAAERAAFEEAKDAARLAFWPIANIRKKMVSMYLTRVEMPQDVLDAEPSESGALEAAVDLYAVEGAGAVLADTVDHPGRAFMVLPVHFGTLSVKRFRESYIETCRRLPPRARTRLFLLVRGLADGVPQATLHNTFSYVAPFVAGFIGGFGLTFDRAAKLAGTRLVGIAASGADLGAANPAVVAQPSDFVTRNKTARMRSFFIDAPNPELATFARKVRFDYLQGDGLAQPMHTFGRVLQFG